MKHITPLLLLIAVVFVSFTHKPQPSKNASLTSFADSLFQAHIDKKRIAGGAVIVFQKGKMLLNKAYGYANLELSVPMPPDGVFEIGSVTKQFTAAAIFKLAQQGKLSLDDDFTKYVKYDTKGRTITIKQLLYHTSGINNYTAIPEFKTLSFQSLRRDSLLRILEQKDFNHESGQAMSYTNSGYFLLGLIIEKASGKSYKSFLKEAFFKPLKMQNTHYSSNTKIIKNKVFGYRSSPFGLRQRAYTSHTWPYAAGSLCSTTADLLRWMRALHEGKVFNKKQYTQFVAPGTLKDGSPLSYAMGLTNYQLSQHKMIGHGGGIAGFLSETRYFPKKDLYIIVLVNTTGRSGASFFAEQLTWKLLKKRKAKPVAIDIDLKSLEGIYSGQIAGNKLTIEVKALANGLKITNTKHKFSETLNTYIGNSTWLTHHIKVRFTKDACHQDHIGGYYILKKIK